MSLKTLENVKKIGGFEVKRVSWNQPKDNFIEINETGNSITFNIQDGLIKENGVNGCQVDTIIETARVMLEGLSMNLPCRETSVAITKLDEALMWLNKRTQDRITRGVEGKNES